MKATHAARPSGATLEPASAWRTRFEAFVARKVRDASRDVIEPLVTAHTSRRAISLAGVGNAWTRSRYDGDFHLLDAPADLPALTLVFVQSRDGNTATDTPEDLGGGPTDKHLLYEGLTRVAADGVLAGARTATGGSSFFSVWHPALTSLRATLGLPRHPAQIVVSDDGRLDLDGTLLFNVPEVPVFVLAGGGCRARCQAQFAQRPWIRVVPLEAGWPATLRRLRSELGLARISVIGGRSTAASLINAGMALDLVLTTTPDTGGAPGTPYYAGGAPPGVELITEKRGAGPHGPIRVEHLAFTP